MNKLRILMRFQTRTRRLGCIVFLIIWFVLLLSPCFFIVLATQGEINIQIGNIPSQTIRIWLIDGAQERGIAISRPTLMTTANDEKMTCVQTDTSFLLWMGHSEPISTCECYSENYQEWNLVALNSGLCP